MFRGSAFCLRGAVCGVAVCAIATVCLRAGAQEQPSDEEEPEIAQGAPGLAPEKKPIMHFDHLLGGQYGPPGMIYELSPYFRWDLFPHSKNILLEDAHIKAGLTVALTPAVAYYGPSITIAPLTILHVNVQFTHVICGVSGPSLGLLDYNDEPGGQYANFDYSYRNKHGGELGRVTADIWSLFIKPALFLQAGPVVFVYLGSYMYFRPTDFKGFYYNDLVDLILTEKSWAVLNDAMLLYEFKNLEDDGYGILAGIDAQINLAVDDGKTPNFETAYRAKLGIAASWTFTNEWLDYAIEEPTVLLQAHYYLKDPIMPGKERPVGFVLAFMMSTNWYKKSDG